VPNAESPLTERFRLQDSGREVSMGRCIAATFCFGAVGAVTLLAGAGTVRPDHLKMVGN
jgi:hypothetical protein